MNKKIIAMLLSVAMIFTVVACGNGKNDSTEGGKEVGTPTITKLADYSDMASILTGDYEIKEDDLANGLTSLLSSAGVSVEWTEVKDRDVVAEDDIVNVDYTGYLDDKAFAGGTATDQLIDVKKNCSVSESTGTASSGYIDGFTSGLAGAKVGEKVSYEVTFPENYGSTDLAGKTVTFEFKVNGIYTCTPYTYDNITDEFVKEKLVDYELETVEDLKKYVKEELTFNSYISYIIANTTVDIPDDYVAMRVDAYQAYLEKTYCSESMPLETMLAYYYGQTLEQAREDWTEGLTSQAKVELVFAEMVKNEKLELDEKAHEEYIASVTDEKSNFKSAEDVYNYVGAGNVEAGEAYLKNEASIREFVKAKMYE